MTPQDEMAAVEREWNDKHTALKLAIEAKFRASARVERLEQECSALSHRMNQLRNACWEVKRGQPGER